MSAADKRRALLDAAISVFARKGYHSSRVSDIAEEAGVAHGLLYHYFDSKEELLETVFRETWTLMLDTIKGVEDLGEPAREQLRKVAAIVLRAWRDTPDVVRVLVREVTRSPHLQHQVLEIDQAFRALERIIARGQALGEFRQDLNARFASFVFYGALEEMLTGWVLGQLPDSDEDIAQAERTVVETLCDGMLSARTPVKA